MINKITNNSQKTFNFKANSENKDKINHSYEQIRLNSFNTNKIDAISATTALLVGAGAKVTQKSNDKAFSYGLAAYFTSTVALLTLSSLKQNKESKDFYEKYMKDMKYKNKFDEFVSKKSIPMKIDFGNEEKNKTYFDLAHSDKKRSLKSLLYSFGAGIITAGLTGTICSLKSINGKFEKTYCAGMLATLGTLIFNIIKNTSTSKKEYEEQKVIS